MLELIPALPDNVVGVVAEGEVTAADDHGRFVDLVDEADASAWVTA